MPLDTLGVNDRNQADLWHSRRTVRKNLIQTLRRDLAAIIAIPAGCVVQQKINGSPGPGGLFGECTGDVADFSIGRSHGMTIRMPRVVERRAAEREQGEDANCQYAQPQASEPN